MIETIQLTGNPIVKQITSNSSEVCLELNDCNKVSLYIDSSPLMISLHNNDNYVVFYGQENPQFFCAAGIAKVFVKKKNVDPIDMSFRIIAN